MYYALERMVSCLVFEHVYVLRQRSKVGSVVPEYVETLPQVRARPWTDEYFLYEDTEDCDRCTPF